MKLPPIQHNSKYASFLPRFLAVWIDSLILNLGLPITLIYLSSSTSLTDLITRTITGISLIFFPSLFVSFFYAPFCLSRFGQTIGKALTGVKITTSSNQLLSFKQAIFREFFTKIAANATFGLGYLFILYHPEHLGWHDQLSGTEARRLKKKLAPATLSLIILLGVYFILCFIAFNRFFHNSSLLESFNSLI